MVGNCGAVKLNCGGGGGSGNGGGAGRGMYRKPLVVDVAGAASGLDDGAANAAAVI